jgi:hypothetical protein
MMWCELESIFIPTTHFTHYAHYAHITHYPVENLQGVLNRLFDLVIAKVRKTSARKRLDEAILAGDVILLEGAIESARRWVMYVCV